MQVKLITTVETIIDVDPENTDNFETAKGEIFTRLLGFDQDDISEGIKDAHAEAVEYDQIRAQSVTHSFSKVE